MKQARKRLAQRLAAQEIRIDERHTIKLRTHKWFPEMIVAASLAATAGAYLYGKEVSHDVRTYGLTPDEYALILEAPLEIEHEKALEAELEPVADIKAFAAAPRPKASTNPRIIEATTHNKAITVGLDSAQIVGDEAVITYRIYNRGKDAIKGRTWAGSEQKDQAESEKLTWQARHFTIKSVSVPAAAGEAKIFVSEHGSTHANSYTVKF